MGTPYSPNVRYETPEMPQPPQNFWGGLWELVKSLPISMGRADRGGVTQTSIGGLADVFSGKARRQQEEQEGLNRLQQVYQAHRAQQEMAQEEPFGQRYPQALESLFPGQPATTYSPLSPTVDFKTIAPLTKPAPFAQTVAPPAPEVIAEATRPSGLSPTDQATKTFVGALPSRVAIPEVLSLLQSRRNQAALGDLAGVGAVGQPQAAGAPLAGYAQLGTDDKARYDELSTQRERLLGEYQRRYQWLAANPQHPAVATVRQQTTDMLREIHGVEADQRKVLDEARKGRVGAEPRSAEALLLQTTMNRLFPGRRMADLSSDERVQLGDAVEKARGERTDKATASRLAAQQKAKAQQEERKRVAENTAAVNALNQIEEMALGSTTPGKEHPGLITLKGPPGTATWDEQLRWLPGRLQERLKLEIAARAQPEGSLAGVYADSVGPHALVIARALARNGRLALQEYNAVQAMFPRFGDTESTARQKLIRIRQLLQQPPNPAAGFDWDANGKPVLLPPQEAAPETAAAPVALPTPAALKQSMDVLEGYAPEEGATP